MIFTPFPHRVGPISSPPTFGRSEGSVDETLRLIDLGGFAKLVSKIGQCTAQHFVLAPQLKAAMHGFIVRITLRKHVPLRTGIENPQHGFQHLARWNGFTPHPLSQIVFFGDRFDCHSRKRRLQASSKACFVTSSRCVLPWCDVIEIESDSGRQLRHLHFKSPPSPRPRTLQGRSIAQWERPMMQGTGCRTGSTARR
jgi:hypothetical protein